MEGAVHAASLAGLAILLALAIVSDVRHRLIPNWLTLAVAALALPWWWSSGAALWPTLGWQVGLAGVVLLVFGGLFAIGWMGGGDVKLLVALALWLPPLPFLRLLMVMALAGGVLTALMLGWHRWRANQQNLEIPYGVAIAFAAYAGLGEPVVKHFVQ